MNKKLFFGMFAAATMLFATSCSNDEMDGLKGNESVVSFTLEQPGISTRAYSDGLSAERLSYAVFEVDANGTVATTPTYEDVIDVAFTNKQANITFALEKGKRYKFAFWADNAESPYEFDANTGKVTVDYTDNNGNNLLLSNDENRDAFFANDEVTIPEDGSSVIKTITLYRPFAQLNIGAIGNNAVGLENPTKSEVSIASGVYKTLNILTGEVEDEVGGVTYALNTIPEATEVFPVDGVDNYFSMNYLLVSKDKELVEVNFTLATDNNKKSRIFPNIPVQRNHRTNIYGTIGNIVSEAAEFMLTVDERYDEHYHNANMTGIRIGGEYYTTFADALANIVDGDIIELGAGTYTIPSSNVSTQGKTLTFVGTGCPHSTILEFEGTPGASDGPGVNYSFDGSSVKFENLGIKPNTNEYACFARCEGTYKNCVIDGTYYLPQEAESHFEDCTFNVEDNKYNLWTWGAPKATFTNCTFNCDGKAVLVYAGGNHEITFNKCTFNDNGDGTVSGKAAVEVGDFYSSGKYDIYINSCTVNGFDVNSEGTNTGTTLWGNKNGMTSDLLNVVIDGVDVL